MECGQVKVMLNIAKNATKVVHTVYTDGHVCYWPGKSTVLCFLLW